MKVLPVIHHLDVATSQEQADIAFDAGADGVFVICHGDASESELAAVAKAIKRKHRSKAIGLNLLGHSIVSAAHHVKAAGLDMVWGDYCGVSSFGVNGIGEQLAAFAHQNPAIEVFASVAFKYQAEELDPPKAAENALRCGFIPTTSGSGTGVAAPVEKIQAMSVAVGGRLAIASGMNPGNVQLFAPYLSHILVATGVSLDNHHFDFETLCRFIGIARRSSRDRQSV